ncbi:IS66 family transposase, partial [Escherichia coli]
FEHIARRWHASNKQWAQSHSDKVLKSLETHVFPFIGNVYCSNGWVGIDNNIAENALRGVAVGRKNWLFAGSDSGDEHAAVLYSLIGTCRLNNVEPEKWLRYVIEHIQD